MNYLYDGFLIYLVIGFLITTLTMICFLITVNKSEKDFEKMRLEAIKKFNLDEKELNKKVTNRQLSPANLFGILFGWPFLILVIWKIKR